MRLHRMKFSLRGMMIVVLGFGVGLHLAVAVWRAYRSGVPHVHSAILENSGNPAKLLAVRNQPFWPAFWRHSTGMSWGDRTTCFMGGESLMEMCELADPEIRMPLGPNIYGAFPTSEQNELFERLRRPSRAPSETREPGWLGIADAAMEWMLDSPLPRCRKLATCVRIAAFCASGVQSLLSEDGRSDAGGVGAAP